MTKRKLTQALLASALILFAAGCKKKTPAPPPPPPPPPAVEKPAVKPQAPAISFTAEPSSVQRGQAATLRWTVRNADSITIEPGVGTVAASGSRQVYPSESTTYTLCASGGGGSDTATARVSVTEPPPPPVTVTPQAPRKSLQDRLDSEVSDIFFNYDKYDVREDARSVLTRNADALKAIFTDFPGSVVSVEGHCDERGSAEYNLGLGDRRSSSTKDFLVQLGVPADRLKTVSYGKERPQCSDASESCWQKNRRSHFAAGQ